MFIVAKRLDGSRCHFRMVTNLEKPGILRKFFESGELMEFLGNSVQP